MIPPLLNDFIGLQKDTSIIVRRSASAEAAAAGAATTRNTYFNYTGYVVGAVFFVLLTIPLARYTDT